MKIQIITILRIPHMIYIADARRQVVQGLVKLESILDSNISNR